MVFSVILIDFVARMLGIIRSLVNPKALGAAEYGRLGLLSAVLLFAVFCDLGKNREFELLLPRVRDTKLLLWKAFREYSARALVVGLVLCTWIYWHFSAAVALAVAPYIFFFGTAEILLILFRARKYYMVLNGYALLTAVVWTLGTIWIAPRFGLLGLAGLQSGVSVLGILALMPFLPKALLSDVRLAEGEKWLPDAVEMHSSLDIPPNTPSSLAPLAMGSAWLLLGQLLAMFWLSVDRLYLSQNLSAVDLGFWTLGTLPGSILVGISNTLATLHMAAWIRRERPLFRHSELAAFCAITLAGCLAFGPFIRFFLPTYTPGIPWNIRLILAQAGIAMLFYYDGYRRTLLKDPKAAQIWFWIKFIFSILGFGIPIVLAGLHIFAIDPRFVILMGIHGAAFFIWAYERQFVLLVLQLVWVALSFL